MRNLTINNAMNRKDTFLLASGITLSIIAIGCFLFHAHLERIPLAIIDFAEHHFILFGFICLIAALFIFKSRHEMLVQVKSKYKQASNKLSEKRDQKLAGGLATTKKQDLTKAEIKENTIKVSKEFFAKFKFNDTDVLPSYEDRLHRQKELLLALKLSNLYKEKVTLVFKELNGLYRINTTIWHVDKENVSLKGGTTLPIKSILQVKF